MVLVRASQSIRGHAERYDRARPKNPYEAIDRLGLTPGAAVVEVGCGTGLLSRLLLVRGCELVGVEPDGRMATVACARVPGLRVEEATFESWDPEGRVFDLVVSA